jgi:hypothetical protein
MKNIGLISSDSSYESFQADRLKLRYRDEATKSHRLFLLLHQQKTDSYAAQSRETINRNHCKTVGTD